MRLLIGLMSGTSMDGIDAALVNIEGHQLIAGLTCDYSENAKQQLQSVLNNPHSSPASLSQLDTILGREFAMAVSQVLNKAKIEPKDIVAIGSHGQTICHDATAAIPYTVQLGCPHTIAELTGITVVADFRTRDLVIGGQGAPFAPIYHQALFNKKDLPMAVINIGGIANVTYIAPGQPVKGYDIGPGNCLLDLWVQRNLNLNYDGNGAWAATGQVIQPLLSRMLQDPYFQLPFPKSLGKEYFSYQWLEKYLEKDFLPKDVQATLLAFTATTIATAIQQFNPPIKQLAICGGGVHNHALIRTLSDQLDNIQVNSTINLGVDPDFIEAMMFAWLADKTINNTPLDFTQITGAKHIAIYGAIYPKGIDKRNSVKV